MAKTQKQATMSKSKPKKTPRLQSLVVISKHCIHSQARVSFPNCGFGLELFDLLHVYLEGCKI